MFEKQKEKKAEREKLKQEIYNEVKDEIKEEIKQEYKEKIKQQLKDEMKKDLKTPGEKLKDFGQKLSDNLGSKATVFDNSENKVNKMLNIKGSPEQKKKSDKDFFSEDKLKRMLGK